jgi:hypothetical protein
VELIREASCIGIDGSTATHARNETEVSLYAFREESGS